MASELTSPDLNPSPDQGKQTMLDDLLALLRLRFLFTRPEPLRLPAYLGSTWRGALVSAFRRINCVTRLSHCAACTLRPSCPYTVLFEPSLNGNEKEARYRELPRPFVIEPACADNSSSSLSYDLLLFGQATHYVPYFILANQELANHGLGAARKPVRFEKMLLLSADNAAEVIWEQNTGKLTPTELIAGVVRQSHLN